MMPMLPAKAVSIVRPFLVLRLLNERLSAVRKDMLGFFLPVSSRGGSAPSGLNGSGSPITSPSSRRTMRVEYFSASSALWVTMTTSLSFAISCSSSMICTLVALSSAPVGSSASRMSGSLIRARAIATRCIWPPDIWLGFLFIWSPRPTRSSTFIARSRLSARSTPEMVSASSTLARTLWCGMRL